MMLIKACLECYNCTKVRQLFECSDVIQCPPGYICSSDKVHGMYTLGCKNATSCPVDTPGLSGPSLVGRDADDVDDVHNYTQPVEAVCHQCCTANHCNRQLCQSMACNNTGDLDCETAGAFLDICAQTDHAKKVCQHFCGLCDMVDGGWSNYTRWTSCSVTCGNGTESRIRTCSNPVPRNGGKNCTGGATDTRNCSRSTCPDTTVWGDWSPWSHCSVSCGIGLQRRSRTYARQSPAEAGHQHCSGNGIEDKVCLSKACQDGGWSAWGNWSTCDGGIQKRSRTCINPTPSLLGKGCPGDPIQVQLCSNKQCRDPQIGFTASIPHKTKTSGHIGFYSVSSNVGGDFDATSGEFVCTRPGVYFFDVNLLAYIGVSTNWTYASCSIYHNDKVLSHAMVQPEVPRNQSVFYPATGSAYVHLSTGDKVYLGGCTVADSMNGYSSFTGYLVKADCF